MPRRIQCLVCRRVLSSHDSKHFYAELDVEYAYCERCYRERVAELEATIAGYKACVRRYNGEQGKHSLNNHWRQVDFLSSGWSLGQECKLGATQSHELQSDASGGQQGVMFSDVLLVPEDGPPVPAHKAILAGRSSVFRAMFCRCLMREARSGVVMIKDLNAEVLAAFVGFLYTANVVPEVMQKHAVALLSVAEKYDVALLRVLCEEAIATNIGPHNAVSMLELARKFGSQVLRTAVLEFVSQDVEQLLLLEEYPAYAKKDPSLLIELYEGLVERNHIPMLACDIDCRKRTRSSAL